MKKLIFIFFFGACFLLANAQTSYWNLNGNTGITDSNFLGTTGSTDCDGLIFKTRNIERMRLAAEMSFLGIGTSKPLASLHLHYQMDKASCKTIADYTDAINRKLLQLTTPETGMGSNNGFYAAYSTSKELLFKQQENANFFIEGANGGLTIAPNGNIGVGAVAPYQKLQIEEGNLLFSKSTSKTRNAPVGAIIFDIGLVAPNTRGCWGIEYIDDELNYPGLNFWRCWNNGGGNNYNYTLFLKGDGSVGIGTRDPQAKLDVNGYIAAQGANIVGALTAQSANISGKIKAKEVEVTLDGWSDFVFENDYNLRPLPELKQYIKQNNRLPEIPSAKEVMENGINLGDMQSKLLQKIEELTLYILQQEKKITDLQNQMNELKKQ